MHDIRLKKKHDALTSTNRSDFCHSLPSVPDQPEMRGCAWEIASEYELGENSRVISMPNDADRILTTG